MVPIARFGGSVFQHLRQPLRQVGCTRLAKGREYDRHQTIEDAEVVGLHGREHPVR